MSDDHNRSSPRQGSGTKLAILVVLAYLIPLALIFLDEVVFRTFFIWKATPEWGREVIKIVYFPIKMIFGK